MLRIDENENIYLSRGDSADIEFLLTSSDEEDLTGVQVIFSMGRGLRNQDEPIWVKEYTVDEEGIVTLRIDPEDTANLPDGIYYYSMTVVFGENVITPLEDRHFEVGKKVPYGKDTD